MIMAARASGQKIDNTVSYRGMSGDRYLRINYDNDLFAGQDQNYTQGYSIELVSPVLSKNPVNKIFFQFAEDRQISGIVFEHLGYTPERYDRTEIQIGDRPFAGVATLKYFKISINEKSKQRITSQLNAGVMGPAAIGKEIQTSIHEITGSLMPRGWKNQINNQFVLNYAIDYEMELTRIENYLGLTMNASATLGNLNTKAAIGFSSTFGLVNDPYRLSKDNKFLLYGYVQSMIAAVGYDGTLQGAILGNDSVYTIPAADVSRLVGQVKYGLILQTSGLYLEYSRSSITREIKTLEGASWGGFRIGLNI